MKLCLLITILCSTIYVHSNFVGFHDLINNYVSKHFLLSDDDDFTVSDWESTLYVLVTFQLMTYCNDEPTTRVYEVAKLFPKLNDCSCISICNETHCIAFDPTFRYFQSKFSMEDLTELCQKEPIFTGNNYVTDARNPCHSLKRSRRVWSRISSKCPGEKYEHIFYDQKLKFPLLKIDVEAEMKNISISAKDHMNKKLGNCSGKNNHLIIEDVGELPIGCYEIWLGNKNSWTRLPLPTQFMFKLYERKTGWCTAKKIKKRQRRAPINYKNRTYTTTPIQLSFNLPGYRFCGPGTNIELQDDKGGPINDLDAACRSHDIAYLLGGDPNEADDELLAAAYKSGSPWYQLFMAAFQAKSFFEYMFGKNYTSSLYFSDTVFQSSFIMYFYETSVYENITTSNTENVKKGEQLEAKWKRMVLDIWQGTCSLNQYSLNDEEISDYRTWNITNQNTNRPLMINATVVNASITSLESNLPLGSNFDNIKFFGLDHKSVDKLLHWPVKYFDKKDILFQLHANDKTSFCKYCTHVSTFFMHAEGIITGQIVMDIQSCLQTAFCENIFECSNYNAHPFSTSDEFLLRFVVDKPQARYLNLNSSNTWIHCRGILENLIKSENSDEKLLQIGYDLRWCTSIFSKSNAINNVRYNYIQSLSEKNSIACGILGHAENEEKVNSFNPYDYVLAMFHPTWIIDVLLPDFNLRCSQSNLKTNFTCIENGVQLMTIITSTVTESTIPDLVLPEQRWKPVRKCYSGLDVDDLQMLSEKLFKWPNETTRRKRYPPLTVSVTGVYNPHQIRVPMEYPYYENGCMYLINEFSTSVPSSGSKEFSEKIRLCPMGQRNQERTMRYLWELYIVLHPNLGLSAYVIINYNKQKMTFKENQMLFTVGSAGLHGIDMEFSNEAVQFVSSDSSNILPDGKDYPVGIFLLHTEGKGYHTKSLKLPKGAGGKKMPLRISQDLFEAIKRTKVDCVFYSSNPRYDDCEIFRDLCPQIRRLETNVYIQRDWERDDPNDRDLSISRCVSHIFPYDQFAFKHTAPSPGRPNFCDQGTPFILESNFDTLPWFDRRDEPMEVDVEEVVQVEEDVDEEAVVLPQPVCQAVVAPQEVMEAVPIDAYRQVLNEELVAMGHCYVTSSPYSRLVYYMTGLKELQDVAKPIEGSPYGKYIWDQPLDPAIYNHVLIYQADYINPVVILDANIGWWLGHIPTPDHKQYRFYCKICLAGMRSNSLIDRPSSNMVKKIMTTEGVLFTGPDARLKMKKEFKSHAVYQPHKNFVEYAQELAFKEEFTARMEIREAYLLTLPPLERNIAPTINFYRKAIGHVNNNFPLQTWAREAKATVNVGGQIGFMYQNYRGITRVLRHCSNFEMKELLKEIKPGRPISIFMDGYTDRQGTAYMGIFVFLMYKGRPQAKFFAAEDGGSDSTGLGYLNTFFRAVKKWDTPEFPLLNILRKDTVSVSADGASANRGAYNSFHSHFKTWLGRDIPFIWCYSHRTNLVLNPIKSDISFIHFRDIMKSVNKIYRLFGPLTKRRKRLAKKIKATGSKVSYLARTQETRWAASFVTCFKKILTFWLQIYEETVATIADTSASVSARASAKEIEHMMRSPHYITGSCWLWGMFQKFAVVSKATQYKNSPAIDQAHTGERLLRAVRSFQNSAGDECGQLFKHFECEGVLPPNVVTLEDIESKQCSFHGIKLRNPTDFEENISFLSSIRTRMIAILLSKVWQYFPRDQEMQYKIFHPKNFPRPPDPEDLIEEGETADSYSDFISSVMEYGIVYGEDKDGVWKERNHFTDLAKTIGVNDEDDLIQLHTDFTLVVLAQVEDAMFPEKITRPSVFWNNALEDSTIPWTENLKQYITKVLVIPSGISDAERLFSEISDMVGLDRLSLYPETVDHLLRIKHSVPSDITEWEPYYHVVDWLQAGNCRSDDDKCRTGYRTDYKKKDKDVPLSQKNPVVDEDPEEEDEALNDMQNDDLEDMLQEDDLLDI